MSLLQRVIAVAAVAFVGQSAFAAPDAGAVRLGPPTPPTVSRVVTLAPSLTQTVLALGAGDRLVGVSRFDDAPSVQALPRVGGFNDPSVESVLALKPQLVLVQKAPGNQKPVETIARLGVSVVALPLTTVDDVLSAVREVGRLLGRAEQGEALVARIDAMRQQVRQRAQAMHHRPTVLLVYGFRPLVVAGPGSFAHELLTDAGAINAASKAPTAYPVFSLERAVALKPDVVVDVADVADGRDEVRGLLKHSQWVKPRSKALLQPGPDLGDGLSELQQLLMPPSAR